jgi:hypothetical protein
MHGDAPNSIVMLPDNSPATYRVYHFHVDFATPLNSTLTFFGSSPAAGWTALTALVPELGVTSSNYLDNLADRLMFRLAYRNFGDHESIVYNHTIDANGTDTGYTGIRWYEVRSPRSSPTIFPCDLETKPDKRGTHADSAFRNRLASRVHQGVPPRHRGQLIDRSDNHKR